MTELRSGSPIKRETAVYYRGRPLIIEAHPGYLVLRQKGKRTSYSLEYSAIYECAGRAKAMAERAEKLRKKKQRQ